VSAIGVAAAVLGAIVGLFALFAFIRGLGSLPDNDNPPGRSDGMG